MSKMDPWNFLEVIKELVTGGGRLKSGTLKDDAGFARDMNFSLTDIDLGTTFTANTTTGVVTASGAILTSSETNIRVASFAASTTAVGSIELMIPRDYDEATDTFALKISIASAGATNSPTLTATVYKKSPGAAAVAVATSVNGTAIGGTAALALTANAQIMEFVFDQKGLLRDDAITITLTATAHTTDAILVYGIEPIYRSTLVSYHESDGNPRDGKSGNFLR